MSNNIERENSTVRKAIWSGLGLTAVAGLGMLFLPASVMGRASGPCVDCHTMHNSQDNAPMTFDVSATPNPQLLRGGCIYCHMATALNGPAGNTGANSIPYVLADDATRANYGTDGTDGNTLAGGNFYWVQQGDDAKGHNVVQENAGSGIAAGAMDATPPGQAAGAWPAYVSNLQCGGTNGCHGDRTQATAYAAVRGSHHADDSTIDGLTVPTSYRFLLGVVGTEDSDWEYLPDASNHNQYKGIARTADGSSTDAQDAGIGAVGASISSLCGQCHTNFHQGSDNISDANNFQSPWVRHPTDLDLSDATGTEYANYGGGTHVYQVTAPVASEDVSVVLSSVLGGSGTDAIVMCLSCHRAHGTPNDDLLRWDYDRATTTIIAGGTGTGGCLTCHTTK